MSTGNKSNIVFEGKIFEIEQAIQPDGRVFEVARRAPGVRLIIPDRTQRKLLLTKEFRKELNDWDFRLPGGKVFDTLKAYDEFRASGDDIMKAVLKKGKEEGLEEAGIDVRDLRLFKKSTLGATVEWDLYVLEVTDWELHKDGQQLEAGEDIEADNWVAYEEVKEMIIKGEMQEDRIALILLQWLAQQ